MTREEAIKELEEDKALYMPEEWIESLDRDTPDGRLITALDMAIEALRQKPKTGRWIDDCGGVKCSCCGYSIDDCFYAKTYCTNCGAKTESEVEECH